MLVSTKWSFAFMFADRSFMRISHRFRSCYMLHASNLCQTYSMFKEIETERVKNNLK